MRHRLARSEGNGRRLATITLGHVGREYPNYLTDTLAGPGDARTPAALHPAFGLRLAAAYAHGTQDDALTGLLAATAERWYGADCDCRAWGESGGDDTLSAMMALPGSLVPVARFAYVGLRLPSAVSRTRLSTSWHSAQEDRIFAASAIKPEAA